MPSILCVPIDLGASLRGASLGPESLQLASTKYKDQSPFVRYSTRVLCRQTAHSYALPARPAYAKYLQDICQVSEQIASAIDQSIRSEEFPYVLSGDHSSATAILAGSRRAYPGEKIGIVWIDAHADLQTPYTSTSGNMHGMSLAAALGLDNTAHALRTLTEEEKTSWEGLQQLHKPGADCTPIHTIFVGARSIDTPEEALISEHNMCVIRTEEVRKNLTTAYARITNQLKDCSKWFVSFDVDVLDSVLVPGTGTPVEKGLSFDEVCQLSQLLMRESCVCGWEITELNPLLDHRGKTTQLIADYFFTLTKYYEQR